VDINSWTFIAQILNLFIQIYLIKRFLFKPIQEVLKKRQELSDEQLDSARRANAQAEALRMEYEGSMAQARTEAARIISSARTTAREKSDAIIADANAKAAAAKAKAEADIQQERKKAVNELKNEIGGIAVDLAGRVIEREISEDDHRKLIDEFIESVGEAS
jgi:F-type H+-transporting ATPase subunit b